MIDDILPYGMFDQLRTAQEAASAKKIEQLYHKGQDAIWDGRRSLDDAVARHGGPSRLLRGLSPARARAVGRIYGGIMWGELAAWKISAALALKLEPLEAKMAATAQAHDEARHFYVLHDYLELLGQTPHALGPKSQLLFADILSTRSLAKMLLGMQLMVEPLALTIFQLTREAKIEPVLCDVLALYERDEARHVALGTLFLPAIISKLGRRETASLAAWQLREYFLQLGMLKERADDLRELGIDPRKALALARNKQLAAARMLAGEMGHALPLIDVFRRIIDFKAEIDVPSPGRTTLGHRLRRAVGAALRGEGELDPI
ncbi:MAG: ferritin-like domain-containing protein [Deltaproteobacteria bacterium]|nr:ferritin-like domain-containing protein [Deltaproteobacteria bacterium]